MTVSTFQTAELIGVQRRLPQPVNFWLKFFGRTVTSTSEKIMFDELGEEERRLAPFVAPMAQGKVLREAGYAAKSFKPAYLKPKGIVHPQKLLSRMAGEGFGGTMSLEARRMAVVAELLASQRSQIERRWDWMAAQALIYGSVTVAGLAPDQATKEKIVLCCGNVGGVVQVNDLLTVAEPADESRYYTVVRGDTLSAIAKTQYGAANAYMKIFEANKPMLSHPDKIYPGQVLRIPA